jgi:sarcosine oxidase, subunit gamma
MSEVLERYDGLARVERVAPGGMIALKGDLAAPELATALSDALGAPVPGIRCWTSGPGGRAFWMAPDELLLRVPDAPAALAALQGRLTDAFVMLQDVSDMRAMFRLRGALSRDVLAKLAPVDFNGMTTGQLRRTRLAQVAAMIWSEGAGDWGLVCFRSVADYTGTLLRTAARPGGEVGLYR